jgi:hypothetical protein
MKHRILAWVAAAMALLVCIPGCDDVRFDLQIALDRLIEARMKRDAEGYIRALDPKDLDEYDRLLSAARGATRVQIASCRRSRGFT